MWVVVWQSNALLFAYSSFTASNFNTSGSTGHTLTECLIFLSSHLIMPGLIDGSHQLAPSSLPLFSPVPQILLAQWILPLEWCQNCVTSLANMISRNFLEFFIWVQHILYQSVISTGYINLFINAFTINHKIITNFLFTCCIFISYLLLDLRRGVLCIYVELIVCTYLRMCPFAYMWHMCISMFVHMCVCICIHIHELCLQYVSQYYVSVCRLYVHDAYIYTYI